MNDYIEKTLDDFARGVLRGFGIVLAIAILAAPVAIIVLLVLAFT